MGCCCAVAEAKAAQLLLRAVQPDAGVAKTECDCRQREDRSGARARPRESEDSAIWL